MKGIRWWLAAAAGLVLLAGCEDDKSIQSPAFTPQLVQIEVEPENTTIAVASTQAYRAIGLFTTPPSQNGRLDSADITDSVDWASEDPTIATISEAGVATGVRRGGPITISATREGITGEAELTVSGAVLVRLEVTPPQATVPVGLSQQYTATAVFSDATTQDLTTTADWTSSDTGIGTVNDNGLATGVAEGGPITITASTVNTEGDPISGTAQLTVTAGVFVPGSLVLKFVPPQAAVPEGAVRQVRVFGRFTDNTCRDLTQSARTAQPTSSAAQFIRLDPFDTDVDAFIAYGVPQDPTLVRPPAVPEARDGSSPVVAAAQCVRDTLTAPANSIGFADVNASHDGDGNGTIDAAERAPAERLFLVDAALAAIRVEPAAATVLVTRTQQYRAFAVFSNDDGNPANDPEITNDPGTLWTTANAGIATVNTSTNKGLATGVAPGVTQVVAANSGLSGFAEITVVAGELTALRIVPKLFCVGVQEVPPVVSADGRVPGQQQLSVIGTFTSPMAPGQSFEADQTAQVLYTSVYGVWDEDADNCTATNGSLVSPALASNAAGERGLVRGTGRAPGDVANNPLLLGTSCITVISPIAPTTVTDGTTALILPAADDDLGSQEACDVLLPLLRVGEPQLGTGLPVTVVNVVGQILGPILQNPAIDGVEDVVLEVFDLTQQVFDPLVPVTDPVLEGLGLDDDDQPGLLDPVYDFVNGLLDDLLCEALGLC